MPSTKELADLLSHAAALLLAYHGHVRDGSAVPSAVQDAAAGAASTLFRTAGQLRQESGEPFSDGAAVH